jgi:hypothetical protein
MQERIRVFLITVALTLLTASQVGAASRQPLLLKSGSFDPVYEQPGATGGKGDRYIILQFKRKILKSDAETIENLGGEILGYLPERALIVRLPSVSRLEAAKSTLSLRWAGPLAPSYRVEPGLPESRPESIVVTLFPGEPPEAMTRTVPAAVEPLGTGPAALGASFLLRRPGGFSADEIDRLSGLQGVAFIEKFREATPLNDNTIWVGQSYDTVAKTNYAVSATIWNHGIIGTGQIAAVLDTGLDADACWFTYDGVNVAETQFLAPPEVGTVDPSMKVIAFYAYPGSSPYSASGHGTATMGTVLGDNYANLSTPTSNGHDQADGMAPNAKLVTQVPLGGMSNNMFDAFSQAYESGARVHSNSWKEANNTYTMRCRQVDFYAWEHEDFLPVFAGGNDGGAPDNRMIASPAVSKNVVSVTGCSPGWDGTDARNLLSYSRGPTYDNRIKPDIVAPGNGIVTAGSDGTPDTFNCSPNMGFGGTSSAAPAISGFALLVRQYFTDGFYPSGARQAADRVVPSAALIKAALLNGAHPLEGIDDTTGNPVDPIPSFNQGWGRVLLDSVLYFQGDPVRTRVWDKWNEAGLETGGVDEYTVQVASGTPLKVTLVWTDPPSSLTASKALVHDLDLEVVTPASGTYLGNQFNSGVSVNGGSPDTVNNVEAVLIDAPAAGTYRLRVIGSDVPPAGMGEITTRQGYALVATFAECASSLSAPVNLSVQDMGLAGVRVGWNPVPGASAYTVYRSDGPCGGTPRVSTVVGETAQTFLFDTTAIGGEQYSYQVRATDGCGESPLSACGSAVSTALCPRKPDFGGLESAGIDGVYCSVSLQWSAGASNCALGPDVSYNIYRGTSWDFVPAAGNRIAAGVSGTGYADTDITPGLTYYYVVRAEDSTTAGGGPANGGNEEENRVVLNAAPQGVPGARGVFLDDGGDTAAHFFLSPEWSVSPDQNHTPSGSLSYQSGHPGESYPGGICTSLVSPPLSLDATGSPVLKYWARYNLENQWDGVVVEISEDGGVQWIDLPPDAGYPGSFSLSDDGNGNPINACHYPRTQEAFSGPPGNGGLTLWTQYQSTLFPRYTGKTVLIRFTLSSDSGAEFDGFFLDDIQVTDVLLPQPCQPCTVPASVGNTLKAVKEAGADVHIFFTDVAGAVGYRATGSIHSDMRSEDFFVEVPDGLAGALHSGAVTLPDPYFYKVRGKGNCGSLGP